MTVSRGSQAYRRLVKLIKNARDAKDALPQMQAQMTALERDRAIAQQAAAAQGPNPVATGANRNAAQTQLLTINRSIGRLSKRITKAQELSGQLPDMQTELTALQSVSDYAKKIASVSTIYVRFYSGDKTLPALVR